MISVSSVNMTRRSAALSQIWAGILVAQLAWGQPQRIVSTAPSITELLYALGLGDKVVGVTRFCRYPPEAQSKPKIGDYINPNLEAISALRPDLVIVQTNPVRLGERLHALHLRALEVDQQNIPAIYTTIHTIADATGVGERALPLIESIRKGLDDVRARAGSKKPARAMFVVGRSPGRLDGLVVVGNSSYLNEVMRIAGAENVFRTAIAAYPRVPLEEVLARNPEVIFDMGDMADTVGVTDEHKREVVALWQKLPSVAAVKQHRVFAIASDIYVVPGPRVVDAARSIFAMVSREPR
jgi:iron complex transport system substrate-binding protein